MSSGRIRLSVLFVVLAALLIAPATASGHRAEPETVGVNASLGNEEPAPTVSPPDLPVPPEVSDEAEALVPESEGEEVTPSLDGNEEAETAAGEAADEQLFKCQDGRAGPFTCQNVDLESMLPLGGAGAGNGNDIWGWTDPETGKEYALVGSALETTFIDVTDPQNPRRVGSLPTSGITDFILWRDIKVDGNFAFIVSEQSGHGMQVFDLTRLRDVTVPQVFTADVVYRGADEEGEELGHAHNVAVNEETNFAYVIGSNTCVSPDPEGENGGLHMVDISNPLEPKFAGCALVTDPSSNNYIHDVQCVIYQGPDTDYRGREICLGSNEDVVAIYDVTDKDNPVVISQRPYGSASYTHQGWLTDDHRFFLFGDELDEIRGEVENTTTYIMATSDLDNPGLPKAFKHETQSIDHNLYIEDDLVFASNYGAGLRILEFTSDSLSSGRLSEVGYFDIRPGFDEPEFVGTWSNYPYFKSGIVVMSAIEEGSTVLYVLRPTGRAAGETGGGPGGGGPGGGGPGGGGPGGGGGGGEEPDDPPPGGEPRGETFGSEETGGALAVTGAQLMLFPLLGLALIALGAGIQRLRRRRGDPEGSES